MSDLYIETIRVYNGRVYNIRYHNQRCNHTRKNIFGISKPINLRKYIEVPANMQSGLVKCRITYGKEVQKVEFEPYQMKDIRALKLIEIGELNYRHKSADRKALHSVYEKRSTADDVLMVKNDLLTDTYYANIALLQAGIWYTPMQPLLHGTRRAELIANRKVMQRHIKVSDLDQYEKLTIFNAMIPFRAIILDLPRAIIK